MKKLFLSILSVLLFFSIAHVPIMHQASQSNISSQDLSGLYFRIADYPKETAFVIKINHPEGFQWRYCTDNYACTDIGLEY